MRRIDELMRAALAEAVRIDVELTRMQKLAVELGAFVEVTKDKDRPSLLLRLEIDAALICTVRSPEHVVEVVLQEAHDKLMAEIRRVR